MVSDETINSVRSDVDSCLSGDKSGHAIDHIDRVYDMAVRFAAEIPEADLQIVKLAALLHDVDDYKLVGLENAAKHHNSRMIMEKNNILENIQEKVIQIADSMGYSKSLKGIRPESVEGMIVSDADMCDAIGASGIIRCLLYNVSKKGSGVIFDPAVYPDIDIDAEKYNGGKEVHKGDSFVNHFFEKLFKLKGMMLTEPGAKEAEKRDSVMVSFLKQYFAEYGDDRWQKFFENYIMNR